MNSLAMIEEQGRVVNYRFIVYLKYFRASHPDVLLSVTYHALRGLFGSSITMMSVCGNPVLLGSASVMGRSTP